MNWRFGIVALALLAAGCGDKKADETANETGAPGNTSAATPAPIPSPGGQDWTGTVSETADGGFLMGNPAAPVKLIEYLSITCSHCADFSATGGAALKASYVKSGQVSLEIRNFVRDPVDYSAALLARCAGPEAFFKLTEQLLADQEAVLARFQTIDKATETRIGALPPASQFAEIAKVGGLDQFVRLRGIPADKARACLLDEAAQKKLIDMRDVATKQFDLTGTPTFVLNGVKVDGSDWAALEPKIKAAM